MWYTANDRRVHSAEACGHLAVGRWEFSRAGSKDEVNLT